MVVVGILLLYFGIAWFYESSKVRRNIKELKEKCKEKAKGTFSLVIISTERDGNTLSTFYIHRYRFEDKYGNIVEAEENTKRRRMLGVVGSKCTIYYDPNNTKVVYPHTGLRRDKAWSRLLALLGIASFLFGLVVTAYTLRGIVMSLTIGMPLPIVW